MKAKFEIKKAKDGQWFFHLVAANNKILMHSETYPTKAIAFKCCHSAKRAASEAAVLAA